MPVVSAEPVVTAACVFCCRRAMGAACTRHSPRPLDYRGRRMMHHPGMNVPRECGGVSPPRLSCPANRAGIQYSRGVFGSSTAVSGILGRPVKPDDDTGMLFDIHIRTTRAAYGLSRLSTTAAAFFIASAFAVTFAGTACRFSPGSSKSCVAPM